MKRKNIFARFKLSNIKEVVRLSVRGLALLSKIAPLLTLLYLSIIAIFIVIPILQVWLSKVIVDLLSARHAALVGRTGEIVIYAIIYISSIILYSLLQMIPFSLSSSLEDRITAYIDHLLMQAGGKIPDLYRIERPAFQDDLQRLQSINFLLPRLFVFLQNGLGTALTLVGFLILLASLNPWLPVILAVLSLPHILFEMRAQFILYQAMADRSQAAREMDYCVRITTEADAAKEIRVFDLGEFFLRRFRACFEKAVTEVGRIRLKYLRRSALFAGLQAFVLGGGLWYVATRAGQGHLTLGDVALYLNTVIQSESLLLYTTTSFGLFGQLFPVLRAFFHFIDTAGPAIRVPSGERGLPAPARLVEGLELRHVAFAYPESEQAVLQDVTITLPAGKVTALVGENGAGKSTLVKLLTRMYDPTAGTILLDGQPLADYDLADVRRRIAVVYQDFTPFSLTLRENIAVSITDVREQDEPLERAASQAGVDEITRDLPQGYETLLTRRFEGGEELSGGQWQKVALARGFARDAALVILDEPTSALDAEAEYRLFLRFRAIMAGRTALLISHRFSTVRMADFIIVLSEGKIVEAGTHDELLLANQGYSRLFEMQAERYR